jgi:DNA end-binding protein Ku
VLRERQHLVAVEIIAYRLVLSMLRFANEVVDAPEMADVDRVKIAPKELKLAADLIEALAAEWKPEQYKDDYQENLQEVINSKLKGETIELEGDERPMRAEVIDLAERLRASLKAAESGRKGRSAASQKHAPSSKAAKGRRRAAGSKASAAKSRRKPAA